MNLQPTTYDLAKLIQSYKKCNILNTDIKQYIHDMPLMIGDCGKLIKVTNKQTFKTLSDSIKECVSYY